MNTLLPVISANCVAPYLPVACSPSWSFFTLAILALNISNLLTSSVNSSYKQIIETVSQSMLAGKHNILWCDTWVHLSTSEDLTRPATLSGDNQYIQKTRWDNYYNILCTSMLCITAGFQLWISEEWPGKETSL